MNWKPRIADSFTSPKPDDDVLEELAQHADATYASARAEGCEIAEAERRVEQQIHAWAADPAIRRRRPKRQPAIEAPAGSTSPFAAIAQDTRYAWRLLRRQPAYAALVIATMALGIAATTVLGSVAYGVLLKPLPWADAPRLVQLYETRQGSTQRLRPMMTNATYTEWRRAPATLDALGAWSVDQFSVMGTGTPERLRTASITPSLLPLLRAVPILGHPFVDGDEAPGRPPVILLSHGFWQQRFGGRADVLGQSLRLDAMTYTIVGVMPASFVFPDRQTRAWVPFHIQPVNTPGNKGAFSLSMFQAIGRLRDGVTPAQAAAEGTARGRAGPDPGPVAMAVFGSTGPVEVTVVPMLQALTGEVRPAILILLTAVVLLLATATANVTSLQLARANVRRRELAVRAALGAARGRLVRQALVENLLLGVLGGAAGLAVAALMHRALPLLLPPDFPRLDELAFDVRIQLLAVVLSVGAGLACGLLPALQVGRHELVPALMEDSLAPVGGGLRSRTARARAVIMTGQLAVASVLLVAALLLVRSFTAMLGADLGYDPANVLTARVILPDGEYTPQRRLEVMEAAVRQLSGVDGVSRAAYTTAVPFAGNTGLSSFPLTRRDGSRQQIQTGVRQISEGYFAALGQRVIEGRDFAGLDGRSGESPVIVNREFSRRYLESRALGWTLPGSGSRSGPEQPPMSRPIVGIVENAARQTISDTPEPELFLPARLQPLHSSAVYLVVRTTGDPRQAVPALRAILHTAAPAAAVESIMTLEDRVTATLARPRFYAVLLGTFAACALLIAGVGLFGGLSYSVAQRAREIGVRTALGAQVRDIVGLIVRQSLAIAGAGIAAGLVAAYWLTGALQKFLYGVTPHDAVSFAAVAGVLLLVAIVASIVPARRAARVDPVNVLRH